MSVLTRFGTHANSLGGLGHMLGLRNYDVASLKVLLCFFFLFISRLVRRISLPREFIVWVLGPAKN